MKKNGFVISIVIVIMALEILFLAKSNRELKSFLTKNKVSSSRLDRISKGEYIFEFVGTTEDRSELLSFAGQAVPSLIMIFSVTCTPCQASFDSIIDINNNLADAECRFINVVLSERKYINQINKFKNRKFKLYTTDQKSFNTKYKIGLLPMVLYVDKEGKIKKKWINVIDEVKKQEIIEFIEKS